MSVRCGIDLGTTYSSISWFDSYNNRVETIDLNTADGAKSIRSVVYYPEGEQPPVVGETAWNAARQSPDRVVRWIKRAMGQAFKAGPIDGVEYTPQQVSAEILKVVAQDAQAYLAEEVKDVIITVPAYFGDNERAATEEAGQLAGLNVLGLLPEPHAAALAFAVEKVADIVDKYLLVYDLGGGTFDVTLIHATTDSSADNAISLKIETLCKDGDAELGGVDWDRILAELVTEKVMQAYSVDLKQDPNNDAVLMDNCEKAKRHLTRTSPVSIVADLAGHQVEVSVSEFEECTRDLLVQTQARLEQVLADAETQHGIGKDKIDVMLTGGSSKMPMVKTMIQGILGKPPIQHRNPELLVTIGAAYWAHLLEAGHTVPVPVPGPDGIVHTVPVSVGQQGLTDTSHYSVGIEVVRERQGQTVRANKIILPKGAEYGGQMVQRTFSTSEYGMTEIPVVLYKGEAEDLGECERLEMFTIVGLPPDRPKGQLVEVALGYDASGILRGKAVDVATGKECEIVIDRSKLFGIPA